MLKLIIVDPDAERAGALQSNLEFLECEASVLPPDEAKARVGSSSDIDALLIGFPFGAMGFQGIRGAVFFDAGSGWEDEFDQLYGSFGLGMRVALGYVVVLRFDFSRTTDFRTISAKTDFDFFFGWNF